MTFQRTIPEILEVSIQLEVSRLLLRRPHFVRCLDLEEKLIRAGKWDSHHKAYLRRHLDRAIRNNHYGPWSRHWGQNRTYVDLLVPVARAPKGSIKATPLL
jgi:hypothetical protein